MAKVHITDKKSKESTSDEESKRIASTHSKKSGIFSSHSKTKSQEQLTSYRQELETVDHLILLQELEQRLQTNLQTGLTRELAAELLIQNGPNALCPPKGVSRIRIFCQHMFLGFALLLWIGAILSFVGFGINYATSDHIVYDQAYLGTVILVVIVVTGLFGFYQESTNAAIMEGFLKMIPKNATVIRGGEQMYITCENIVIGDIVRVQGGDCVPADMRVIECTGLKVDNSSITGESEPQMRTVDPSDTNPLETSNLMFFGTNVVEGTGKGVVIACGDNTLMGHIAGLTSGLVPEETPIKKELKRFIKILTILSIIIGLIFFSLAMAVGYTIIDSFLYFIAMVVANVPEGLLVTMTACLTLTAKKMAKKNCLCKHVHAIETLGATTVICSDKTGTLTQNRMTVSHMYYDGGIIDILSDKYKKSSSQNFMNLCRVGILCSRAYFEKNQDSIDIMDREVKGDASESAVLKCMESLVGETTEMRNSYKKIFEVPFNSTNKYQLSVHTIPNSSKCLLVMKGAPERVLESSKTMLSTEGEVELNETHRKKLAQAIIEIGYMGERVLGFADLELNKPYDSSYPFDADNVPTDNLRFVGFMSMIDPARPAVPDAISKCKLAGIKVIMVTGDHPITAMAIAKKVGIISVENDTVYDIAMRANKSVNKITSEEAIRCKATVITGAELRDMERDELDFNIEKYNEIVFARTSPQQKLQIVEAFQRHNEIVAVTGDGVNDSPALKKADIGIAMGITGSDVSKEAADLILLDDNFASIVVGIEEGRLIFDNLKKSIAYMMTSNIPEMVPFMLHVLLRIPLPLSVLAILIIDVGTDLWPGISLAYEKAEADIMNRKPRNSATDRLVSWKLIHFTNLNIGVIQACAGLTCYFYIMSDHGFSPYYLIGLSEAWTSENNALLDSYGQEWTFYERDVLNRKCFSGVFFAIVLTQLADCIICKTRRLSIVQQGMTNMVMNIGMCFEVVIAAVVVYCPYVNDFLGFFPIELFAIIPAVPFALFIIFFDEFRKYIIRKRPGGWLERETYF